MCRINYSIIIPHKNIPKLLERCLQSIPMRDDVQIIVVDDNSDPAIVDFDKFPGQDRSDIEIVFTKEGKGAGYARNVGLDKAVGKWLLFMDADDFFSNQYDAILDKYSNSSADMIICDNKAVMSDDISIASQRDSAVHQYIAGFLDGTVSEHRLRYNFNTLWGKIIRRSMVERNKLRFSETRWSNDLFFSCCTGLFAHSLLVEKEILYIATQRTNSLTSNFCGSRQEFSVRLNEAIKTEHFLFKAGTTPELMESEMLCEHVIRHYGKKTFAKYFFSQRICSPTSNMMIHFCGKIIANKLKLK